MFDAVELYVGYGALEGALDLLKQLLRMVEKYGSTPDESDIRDKANLLVSMLLMEKGEYATSRQWLDKLHDPPAEPFSRHHVLMLSGLMSEKMGVEVRGRGRGGVGEGK